MLRCPQLLARRASTALQPLIIDEGFGSQDDDKLAYVMEALHTIRDDIAKDHSRISPAKLKGTVPCSLSGPEDSTGLSDGCNWT